MYCVECDPETRGIILKNENSLSSMEMRPVYASELTNLGFDKYISYPHSDEAPLLWAKHYSYLYNGNKVASLSERGCMSLPKIEFVDESFIGTELEFVDVKRMLEKNKDLMDKLVNDSLMRIYDAYMKYKDEVDYIQVAFSGGKDSVVLLDLIKRIIPHDAFQVTWNDTGMELEETIKTVMAEKERCEKEGISFNISKTFTNAMDDWKIIGPPSYENRWCCSVSKSVPNVITSREMAESTGKRRSINFLGNRAAESSTRKKSLFINDSVKHKGVIDVNGIINWSSAEVHLYIMMNNLYLHKGYIKGMHRIGCKLCPRPSVLTIALSYNINKEEMEPWIDVIRQTYACGFDSAEALDTFIDRGDWRHRDDSNGTKYNLGYKEYIEGKNLHIVVDETKTSWKTWVKTIGTIEELEEDRYLLKAKGKETVIIVSENEKGLHAIIENSDDRDFILLFKNVFRRAAACIGCRTCEANCPYGHLHFEGKTPVIDDGCLHCSTCHKKLVACIVFNSWHRKESIC